MNQCTVVVSSFLRIDNDFVAIKDFKGSIVDVGYIPGGIELSIDHKTIINLQMWDYIDQLWAYIVDGLVELSFNRSFSVYFPDQPIKFSMVRKNQKVTVGVDKSVATCDYITFLDCISAEAREFFITMKKIAKNNESVYNQYLRKLTTIGSQEKLK